MFGEVDTYKENESNDIEIIRILEEKVKALQLEVENLRKELNYYKSELEKLLSPPLIEAVVLDVLQDGRVVVKSSSGPNLIVNVASNVKLQELKVGKLVALN
ncbi:MAG: proteasome-activating nucleotidase, partial [Sulfolobaceae archaeon]